MKKRILKIAIILLIITLLMPYSIKVQAADRSLMEIYFTQMKDKSEEERLNYLRTCSDEEFEKVMKYGSYLGDDTWKSDLEKSKEKYGNDLPDTVLRPAVKNTFEQYVVIEETLRKDRKDGTNSFSSEDLELVKEETKAAREDAYNMVGEELSSEIKKLEEKIEKNEYNDEKQKTLDKARLEAYKTEYKKKFETIVEKEALKPQEGSKPKDDIFAKYDPDEKTSPDEIINDGTDFLQTGKENQDFVFINGDKVENASSMLFNVLFSIGIGISLLIGLYLGIKFMISSVDDKANIKESLLPYFAGVIIMLASFSIWKLILVLLQALDKI